jgi:hypothetical protein
MARKPFYKRIGFWLVVLAVALVGVAGLSMDFTKGIDSASNIILR